jgi:hypothetical protein
MKKQDAIEKMQQLVAIAADCYEYQIQANDWVKYDKDRTYLAIVETAKNSKHFVKYDFGFIDNVTSEYHPGKKDLEIGFDLSGARM